PARLHRRRVPGLPGHADHRSEVPVGHLEAGRREERVMSRIWILVALLLATPALAASPMEHEEESVSDYVLHHVADAPVWEIEVPLSYEHIVIPLPQIHVPLTAGACTLVEDPAHPG